MRLLVVGASGLVGSEVMRAAPPDWARLGVARQVDGLATQALDLLDLGSLEKTLEGFAPDVVVVASAWPYVDGCEQEPARSHRENVQTVEHLVRALGGSKTTIVFYSTEHVFDGLAPSYTEASPTSPLSVYAKHKREVEVLLLTRGNCLIARTSYVFGLEARRKNFLYRVIDASRQRAPLKVPTKQAGIPTSSRWLASQTLALVAEGRLGLVHLVGPEVLTKGEWAARIADGLALPDVHILEVPWQESGQIAPRPERVCLRATQSPVAHPPLLAVLKELASELRERVTA